MPYKDGIIEAIIALDDSGSGSSQPAIKQYMQSTSSSRHSFEDWSKFHYSWNNKAFLTALKKAVADGDLIQTKKSYKLSAAFKKKRGDAAKRAEQVKEKEMSKKQTNTSQSSRRECAEILMEYLDDKGTVKKETALAALISRLKALPKEKRILAVPLRDSWNEEGLEGKDRKCQEAFEKATEGDWALFVVETHRVDSHEESRGNHIADYPGEVEIDEIYSCDGTGLDKSLLDHLNILWDDNAEEEEGIVACYNDCSIWEDGDREQISGPTSDEEYEADDFYGDCGDPEPQIFEETMHETFFIGISKDLLPKSKSLPK